MIMCCSLNVNVFAAEQVQEEHECVVYESEVYSTRANYGVECCSCGETDYMKYVGMEQAGIGGTTYFLYYKCEKCGGLTTVILNAR